jgi:hypothetical protein
VTARALRKTTRLHQWDVCRANKSTQAWGLEARVPFLDREMLELAMNIDPADKMIDVKSKPDGVHPRLEKWLLRKAFDDPVNPYLPAEVLWRQKEQFSDGVGYDWVDGLKAHAEEEVSDADFAKRAERFPFNPPDTKEYYLLRSLFEEQYPEPCALATVPFGKSIACSTPEAIAWDPKWATTTGDISGRAVDVHDSADGCVASALVPSRLRALTHAPMHFVALQPVPPSGPRPTGRGGKGNDKGDEVPHVERKKVMRETLADAFNDQYNPTGFPHLVEPVISACVHENGGNGVGVGIGVGVGTMLAVYQPIFLVSSDIL